MDESIFPRFYLVIGVFLTVFTLLIKIDDKIEDLIKFSIESIKAKENKINSDKWTNNLHKRCLIIKAMHEHKFAIMGLSHRVIHKSREATRGESSTTHLRLIDDTTIFLPAYGCFQAPNSSTKSKQSINWKNGLTYSNPCQCHSNNQRTIHDFFLIALCSNEFAYRNR